MKKLILSIAFMAVTAAVHSEPVIEYSDNLITVTFEATDETERVDVFYSQDGVNYSIYLRIDEVEDGQVYGIDNPQAGYYYVSASTRNGQMSSVTIRVK